MSNFDINEILQLTQSITAMKNAGIDVSQSMMDSLNAMMQQAAGGGQAAVPEKEIKKDKNAEIKKNFTGLQKRDLSCITRKDDFFNSELYQTLYGNLYSSYPGNPNVAHSDISTVEYMLSERAKEIGKTELQKLFKRKCTEKKAELKAENEQKRIDAEKAAKIAAEAEKQRRLEAGNKTQFEHLPEWCTGNKFVGFEWVTNDDEGVYKLEENGKSSKIVEACGRPVLINRLLEPIDEYSWDGIERIEIAFESERGWKKKVVEREVLLNKNKAISLANDGVDITSDKTSAFTGYMASMLKESSIRGNIPSRKSSRKMAIYKDGKIILPYRDEQFFFEKKGSMPNLVNALQPHGESDNMKENRNEWFKRFKKVRGQKILMFNFLTASTLCAPIIGMIETIDGFVCNVVGPTECGKSVAEAINGSIWGCPNSKSGFVIGAKNTSNAFEIYADVLNCLPLTIDDYNKLKEKEKDAFKQVIYDIANGTGKGRATKDLGLRSMAFWTLNLIVTSEEPVRERAGGGATNRLITCMADDKCPWTPDEITDMMQFFNTNYGHAGEEYIGILNSLGKEKISEMIKTHREELMEAAKNQHKTMKQINAMAIILTADEIAADTLFGDNIKITTEQALEMLDDESVVRSEANCYEAVIDKIYGNPKRFQGMVSDINLSGDIWGRFFREDEKEPKIKIPTKVLDDKGKETGEIEERECRPTTVAIFKTNLQEIVRGAGGSYEMFIDYLRKNNLLYADGGRDTKKVSFSRMDGQPGENRQRAVKFRLPQQHSLPFETKE